MKPQQSARLSLIGLHPAQLDPIDLELPAGHCLALHGPSGSGKTLLLRAIADLDPHQGEALLDGQPRSLMPAPDWRRQVAYLPAESHWWHDSVAPHADDWDSTMLAALGFAPDVLNWQISRLSSGERQRLALVRMLALRPKVLLLDEPSANLDTDNTLRLERVVTDYRERHQASLIWVSHDPAQRQRVANRTAGLSDGKLMMEGETWN